jgi:hypothetical protein
MQVNVRACSDDDRPDPRRSRSRAESSRYVDADVDVAGPDVVVPPFAAGLSVTTM